MSGSGCAPFRDGDSPRQVDWKAYAREAPLLVKEYQPAGAELRCLILRSVPARGPEARLAQLARWVVDAEAAGTATASRLPGARRCRRRAAREQRHRCLAAAGAGGFRHRASGGRPS